MKHAANDSTAEMPHDPEIQEIIGRVPSAIVRTGTGILTLFVLSIFLVSWFIQYPDIIPANVTITTEPAPVTVVTRSSGQIILLAKENAEVKKGDVVAYIQSSGEPEQILKLEQELLRPNWLAEIPPQAEGLGELQGLYGRFAESWQTWRLFQENKSFDQQTAQLRNQLHQLQKLRRVLQKQAALSKQELQLASAKFRTDSLLFTQQVNTLTEFNQAKALWLQQNRATQGTEAAVASNDIQVAQLEKQLLDVDIQKREAHERIQLQLGEVRKELLSQIRQWKELKLVQAPTAGRLAYLGFRENQEFVEAGSSVSSILTNHGKLLARAELPLGRSGKVQKGQKVNIKLAAYPYQEYGLIEGEVVQISDIPDGDHYNVQISIPNKLVTSARREIPFKQNLTGQTEIMTNNLRLLERFVYQLKIAMARS